MQPIHAYHLFWVSPENLDMLVLNITHWNLVRTLRISSVVAAGTITAVWVIAFAASIVVQK